MGAVRPVAVEIKRMAKLPDWLLDAVADAERKRGEGEIPILLLQDAGGRGRRAVWLLVVDVDWLE